MTRLGNGATRGFKKEIFCKELNEDGSKCEWHGKPRAFLMHKALAHHKVSKKQMNRRLTNQGDRGFWEAKYPPSFEECFRLEAIIENRRFDFLFDTDRTVGRSSLQVKNHYRDIVRGLSEERERA